MVDKRRITPWLCLFLLLALVGCRLYKVHMSPDSRILAQARRQYWGRITVDATRGVIRDRRGIALALSSPGTSLFVDPEFWSPENATLLKDFLPPQTVSRLGEKLPGRYFPIERKMDPNEAKKILDMSLPGLFYLKESRRVYPQDEKMAHILGYCDVDGNGISGLELVWNDIIHSPKQIRLVAKDAQGRIVDIAAPGERYAGETAGTVILTVDSRIQHILEERLEEGMLRNKAKWAAGILLAPDTGEVLAMCSLPGFSPNDRTTMTDPETLRNNVIGRVFEPGSTMKPVVMGSAIDMKMISLDETFNCTGSVKIADTLIHDISRHGIVDARKILIKSCNVGMALLGSRLDPERMYNVLRKWGFGGASGIELPGEESGLLTTPEQWYGSVPSNIAIGQGIGVTPLQLAAALAAIANGGKIMRPFLVSRVEDRYGETVYTGRPFTRNTVLSTHTSQWLRSVMTEVVAQGTGSSARVAGMDIAGKTGTAQVAKKGKYVDDLYVSSFAGFWPANRPEYLLLVVLGEPSGGQYLGGKVAAPVFRDIVKDMIQMSSWRNIAGGE